MSKQHQITHDNHTVPQFYLRRWSDNGNTVNCYNTVRYNSGQRKWSSQGIKNMPVWRDLYTQTINGEQDDSIERFFGEIESHASKAIDNLDANGHISESELAVLVDFAIAQMARTPRWLAEQNAIMARAVVPGAEKVHRRLIDEAAFEMLHALHQKNDVDAGIQNSQSPFPAPPIEIDFDASRKEMITKLPLGQLSSLYAMGRVLEGAVAQVLRSYPWTLLRFPDGLELPTSDNPFTKLMKLPDGTYTTNCGIRVKGALLLMPITPSWLLATEVGYGIINQSVFDNQIPCALIVKAIVINADQYVYSHNKDAAIEIIRPSVVDPDYLRDLEKARSEWFGT